MTLNTQPGYGVSFYGSIGLAFVKPGSGVDGVSLDFVNETMGTIFKHIRDIPPGGGIGKRWEFDHYRGMGLTTKC